MSKNNYWSFKKLTGKLHLYLGLFSGIVVFIVSITGCIYVFSSEISDLVYKDRNVVPIEGKQPLPFHTLKENAHKVIPPGITCQRAFIPSDPDKSVSFTFQKRNDTTVFYNSYMEFYKTVYVNPYTGEIVKIENTKWEFFNVVMWMHMTLLFSYFIGNLLVLLSVSIFVFLLISGIILWWPSNKNKRQYFSFQWKKTTQWKRKNYDLHRIPGFYMLIPAFILALTGLYWASDTVNATIKWIADGGAPATERKHFHSDTTFKNSPVHPLDIAIATTHTIFPDARYVSLRFPRKKDGVLEARVNRSNQNYKRDELYFDQYSGKIVHQKDFASKKGGEKYNALNYDIHVGSILGFPGKVLAFIASLISASLPVTGFYIWWGRKKKEKKGRVKSVASAGN